MSVQEFLDHQARTFAAFSWRDLQTANTLLYWMTRNDITVEQFGLFVLLSTLIEQLTAQGFFQPSTTVEQSQEIRRLERSIEDRQIRSYMRRRRLSGVSFSMPGQRR